MKVGPPPVAALFIAILLVTAVLGGIASADDAQYVSDADEWCSERGGELYNSMSIIHGGLHCELQNGTTVHLAEVVR